MDPHAHQARKGSDAPDDPHAGASGQRRCVLGRQSADRTGLIRLVLGPDGNLCVDFSEKLPGRGAWISADRALIETAQAKGSLRAALARAFKSRQIIIPERLADVISAGLARQALQRLGLERKAGHLICGHDKIRQKLLSGQVFALLHAADAAHEGALKLDNALAQSRPDAYSLRLPSGRAELSLALGRENMVHAALVEKRAAGRVAREVGIWCDLARSAGDDAQADGTK